VTGKSAIRCRYELHGNYIWRVFLRSETSSCPTSIEVE
jgi:hypothetical protein